MTLLQKCTFSVHLTSIIVFLIWMHGSQPEETWHHVDLCCNVLTRTYHVSNTSVTMHTTCKSYASKLKFYNFDTVFSPSKSVLTTDSPCRPILMAM